MAETRDGYTWGRGRSEPARSSRLIEAQLEHASIASFAALSLDLLRFGAPAELIRRTHEAALDEIRHAESLLASATGGRGLSFGPLPVGDALSADWAELIRRTFVDGAVGETEAATLAHRRYERAQDPRERARWGGVARDESAHAELAWMILAWAMRERPLATAAVLENELETLAATRGTSKRNDVLSEIVGPCTSALLAAA